MYLSISLSLSVCQVLCPPPRCPSPGQKPAVCCPSGYLVGQASGACLFGLSVSFCPLSVRLSPICLSFYPLLSILSVWPLLYIYLYPLSVWTPSIWTKSVCTLSAWTLSIGILPVWVSCVCGACACVFSVRAPCHDYVRSARLPGVPLGSSVGPAGMPLHRQTGRQTDG